MSWLNISKRIKMVYCQVIIVDSCWTGYIADAKYNFTQFYIKNICHFLVPSEVEQETAVQKMLCYVDQMPSQETFQPPSLPFVSFAMDKDVKYHSCHSKTHSDRYNSCNLFTSWIEGWVITSMCVWGDWRGPGTQEAREKRRRESMG